jgi:type IV pilus assembly protein PilA
MKSLFRKMHKGEKGFTLVEVLVVFTLLAVLSAIMIPNITRFIGYGHTSAASQELSVIQTAMDAMMAEQNISTVTLTAETNDMAAFPTGNVLWPDYLRGDQYSTGNYSCDTTGAVVQENPGY